MRRRTAIHPRVLLWLVLGAVAIGAVAVVHGLLTREDARVERPVVDARRSGATGIAAREPVPPSKPPTPRDVVENFPENSPGRAVAAGVPLLFADRKGESFHQGVRDLARMVKRGEIPDSMLEKLDRAHEERFGPDVLVAVPGRSVLARKEPGESEAEAAAPASDHAGLAGDPAPAEATTASAEVPDYTRDDLELLWGLREQDLSDPEAIRYLGRVLRQGPREAHRLTALSFLERSGSELALREVASSILGGTGAGSAGVTAVRAIVRAESPLLEQVLSPAQKQELRLRALRVVRAYGNATHLAWVEAVTGDADAQVARLAEEVADALR